MDNSNIEQTVEWRLVEDIEQLRQYTEQWHKLVETSQANLFCSPQWIMNWIEIYWQPDWQLKTIMGFEGEKVIAIAPLYLQKSNKLIPINTLFPLGQGEPEESEVLSEFQDIVLEKKNELIYREIANQIQAINFEQFSCHSVLPSSNWHSILLHFKHATVKQEGKRYLIPNNKNYLNTLSKNNRAKWKRCKSKLQRSNAIFFWVNEEDYEIYWQQLILFHQKRWQKKGKKGAFFHPDVIKFHTQFRKSNNTKISLLLIDDEVAAIHYYLYDNTTLYFYQCGWDEAKFAHLSPSYALHIWSILHNPIQNYDFMIGNTNDAYKKAFTGQNKLDDTYVVNAKRSRVKCFISKLINKLYIC
ncbi:GNAT family N-acetyltransferase [Colwellia polaris]|jgi:CelD/BcsL family acetyltransferase involved in cellulose biosynthesis|uniref:GNAT family N-acetyltransferase n=1 Tax=Colwellia polaris TaxID=326537 RepID=UPI001301B316|nr:GNAT family N-acetyltransferase [Colwellia polaris]